MSGQKLIAIALPRATFGIICYIGSQKIKIKEMIRKIMDPGSHALETNIALLLLRLAAGGMMLTHGIGKFDMLMSGNSAQFADPLGMGAGTSLVLTVFAEVLCAILVILGLTTRLASFALFFTMMVAALVIHGPDSFGDKEMALLYAAIFVVPMLAGAGRFSIDGWLVRNR